MGRPSTGKGSSWVRWLAAAGVVSAALAGSAQAQTNANTTVATIDPLASTSAIGPIRGSLVPGLDLSGALTFSSRFYTHGEPFPHWAYTLFPFLEDGRVFPAVSGWTKLSWQPAANVTATVKPVARYDFISEKTMWDLPEANLFFNSGNVTALLGSHVVFWGVAESNHLVDVINQTYLNGDPRQLERLGQPMANLNFITKNGTIALYGLFGFRERNYESAFDRLPAGKVVKESDAVFEDGVNRHIALAARYSNTTNLPKGSIDYAVSAFTGTSRDPRLVPGWTSTGPGLIPYYDHMDQLGLELLYSFGPSQLKFEGIVRRANDETFTAFVAGAEHTFRNVIGGMDLTFVGEYLYDNRSKNQPWTWANNDLFAGVRIALSDVRNTNFVGGVAFDLDDKSKFATFDLNTRLRDNIGVSLRGRFFLDLPKYYGELLSNENYIELSTSLYF